MEEQNKTLIGIDLGGTNARAGLVRGDALLRVTATAIDARGAVEDVMNTLYALVESLGVETADAIGMGVPSVVDVETGVVYDVQNIPSWQEVPVKALMETRYGKPTFVNNDANCFAVGEKYYGHGASARSMIGLILGTGFAGGVIVDGKLYAGPNCGAGEFGMIAYRDGIYEDYCSGQYFEKHSGTTGAALFEKAQDGDAEALDRFATFGGHVGHALKTILYAYDPELIVFGGSVSRAYPFFQEAMWGVLRTFVYPRSVARLRIAISEREHLAVLGAAALALDAGQH